MRNSRTDVCPILKGRDRCVAAYDASMRWAAVALLAGCSFVYQPKPSLDPRAPRPSLWPVLADVTVASVSATSAAIAADVRCSFEPCSISSMPYTLAIGAGALAFALSAWYGGSRYVSATNEPAKQLAGQALAEARRGNCAVAATDAAQLEKLDRTYFDTLADAPEMRDCLWRSCEA